MVTSYPIPRCVGNIIRGSGGFSGRRRTEAPRKAIMTGQTAIIERMLERDTNSLESISLDMHINAIRWMDAIILLITCPRALLLLLRIFSLLYCAALTIDCLCEVMYCMFYKLYISLFSNRPLPCIPLPYVWFKYPLFEYLYGGGYASENTSMG